MVDKISYQEMNILAMNKRIRDKVLSRSECYDRPGNKRY